MRRRLLFIVVALLLASPVQAQFVSDTFTDTATTLLQNHTGETGATWTKQTGVAANDHLEISNANRVRASNVAGHIAYYASGVPATADYDVQATIRRVTLEDYMGIAGRMVTGDLSKYVCLYHTANLAWTLQEYDSAGTAADLDSAAATLADNTDYVVKLEMRGTTLKCYVDTVEILSATDATLSAAGRAGLFAFDGGTNGDTQRFHADTFTATDAPASTRPNGLLLGVGD